MYIRVNSWRNHKTANITKYIYIYIYIYIYVYIYIYIVMLYIL